MEKELFISVPIDYLDNEKELLEKYRFNLELKIFGHDIDNTDFKTFYNRAEYVKKLGIKYTFHAPFIDLSPGGFDEKIRKATEERFIKVLDLSVVFEPINIVFHPGFNEIIHGQFFDLWVEKATITWNNIVDYAEKIGVKISFENIFEKDTRVLEKLLEIADSDIAGICLDVGHHNVFSKKPVDEYFKKFKNKIFELHIHDNHGDFDWHRAVGDGNIDFHTVFKLAAQYCPNAIITLEPHDKETLFKSLENTRRILNCVE